MKSDHKTVVSFVRTKKKFWVLSKDKCKMINCKYAKMEISFLQGSKKKVIMTFSFDKKNLSEDPFALGMKIHWDKRKGVLRLSRKAYLRKNYKEV